MRKYIGATTTDQNTTATRWTTGPLQADKKGSFIKVFYSKSNLVMPAPPLPALIIVPEVEA